MGVLLAAALPLCLACRLLGLLSRSKSAGVFALAALPYAEAMTYFARALGASRTGKLETTRAAIDSLASIQRRLTAKDEDHWAEQVAIQQLVARASSFRWADPQR
jgi:hypothetical protein